MPLKATSSLVTRSAMRVLGYGTTPDLCVEYLQMSERTCLEAMVRFATTVIKVFAPEYLREPILR